jgi:hypothetical protein
VVEQCFLDAELLGVDPGQWDVQFVEHGQHIGDQSRRSAEVVAELVTPQPAGQQCGEQCFVDCTGRAGPALGRLAEQFDDGEVQPFLQLAKLRAEQ